MTELERAAGPGRIRGIALELWGAAVATPERAGATLRQGLRAARALHSAERRLVQDALYGLIRRQRLLEALASPDPLDLWLGWLVLEAGLPPERAAAERPGDWATLAARAGAVPADAAGLALRHSLPEPVAARLVAQLGAEAPAFLAASDARAPVTLRANRRKGPPAALVRRLAAEGVATRPVDGVADALEVVGRANLEGSRAFRDGAFEVQDAASQRVAALVADGPVLDACAGAGGKALALAARGLDVVALDVRQRALDELARRAKRAGTPVRAQCVAADAWPAELPRFPWVLLDAPCTGSGVLRRHPEHRWQLGEAAIAARAATQRGLLSRAAAQVLPGGHLVYATCSVLRDEDEDVVEAFLAAHPGWALDRTLRTWPHLDGGDGFYAAVLRAP
ncbi:MAG: RsmB/NOP family class I SAM-dependent RNA methyltransferase [Myxococcota bacterium]